MNAISNFESRKQILLKEFSKLPEWEDRYKKIIAWGKEIPPLPDEKKTDEAKIKGCQSQVWLHARLSAAGEVIFEGDSDALIVKGLVAVLLRIYSGLTPEEILAGSPDFIKELGFESHLSPSRANGFFSMVKQVRNFATAFAVMKSMRQ